MRSTSGITCCHFFCSAVFSMPVWRNPIVVSAPTTVSPESCRTRRSTPCVLGCCGPILTVMLSLRSSGAVVVTDSSPLPSVLPCAVPCRLDVRDELFLRHLQRLARLVPVLFLHVEVVS